MEKDTLYKYFNGECSAEERSTVRQWVEASPEHFEEFIAERRFFDAMFVFADEMEQPEPTSRPVRRSGKWIGRIAAGVALVVAGAGFSHFLGGHDYSDVPDQEVSVPAGQRLKMLLADGTEVWLNSNTTMRWPGMFAESGRRVEIDGEAYFRVAHNSECPFTVGTKEGDIVVTGTRFNVDAYTSIPDYSVSLIEGGIRLCRPDTMVELIPGRTLSYSGGLFAQTDYIGADTPEWVDGIVSFSDMALTDIIARFEKYYGVDITFGRSDLANEHFSGKFYLEEGIEHALNTLRRDTPFDYTSDKDLRHIDIH